MTGAGAAYALPQANAAQMVADAIDASGGIKELGGAKIKLIVEDTQSDPVTATKLIREMASKHVSAFLGPVISPEVVASKTLLQSLKIPDFTGSGDPSVTDNNEHGWIFRTSLNTGASAGNTLKFVSDMVQNGSLSNVKRVGLVATSAPPGPHFLDVMRPGLSKLGLQETVVQYDPTQVKDFAPTVAKLKAANVDMVTGFLNPNDLTLFAQAVANQSWRPHGGFVLTNSPVFLDSFRKNLGAAVTGWVSSAFANHVDSDYYTPESRALAKAFHDKYGASIEGTSAMIGATNMALIVDAIAKAASKDPAKIADAARSLSFATPKDSAYPYYMAPGGVSFSKNQENTAVLNPFIQVQPGGGWTTIYPQSVAEGKFHVLS